MEKTVSDYSQIYFYNGEIDETDNIIKKLMQFDKKNLNLKNQIDDILTKNIKHNSKCSNSCPNFTWQTCENCNDLKTLGDIEIASTSYILKCLRDSIISNINKTPIIRFSLIDSNFTGLWKNDMRKIILTGYGVDTFSPETSILSKDVKDVKGHLIMGLGPSSSGKTYSAQKIIHIINKANTFISVDGGSYRSSSNVYTYIRDKAAESCVGINNLYDKLFRVSEIKKSINIFLKNQNSIQLNLYIPDTLASCHLKCVKKINHYKKICRDDNWTCVLIWQHKYSTDCNIDNMVKHFMLKDSKPQIQNDFKKIIDCYNFKCKGCSESGTERQIKEGKKYSKKSWKFAMFLGKKILFDSLTDSKDHGRKFSIHNTGGKGDTSILVEYIKSQSSEKSIVFNNVNKDVLNIDFNY